MVMRSVIEPSKMLAEAWQIVVFKRQEKAMEDDWTVKGDLTSSTGIWWTIRNGHQIKGRMLLNGVYHVMGMQRENHHKMVKKTWMNTDITN